MLRSAGLDVWHERMGPDGTVSGLFVFPHSYAPGGHRGDGDRPQDYAFAHRYALVRDPQRVIPSLAQVFQHGDFEAYYSGVGIPMDGDDLTRALRVWVATYRHLSAAQYEFLRVEDVRDEWWRIAQPMGLCDTPPEPGVQNWAHGLQPAGWRELFDRDPAWARDACWFAWQLGYEAEKASDKWRSRFGL